MTGHEIKEMLKNMRLVLCNGTNKLNADYRVSKRGAPYIVVKIGRDKYNVVFFGTTKTFRIFKNGSKEKDIPGRDGNRGRNAVIRYLSDVKNNITVSNGYKTPIYKMP